jgi:hypothetical protein
MSARKTACVTGGSGYIASALVKTLLEKGYAVKTTVRNPGQILLLLIHLDHFSVQSCSPLRFSPLKLLVIVIFGCQMTRRRTPISRPCRSWARWRSSAPTWTKRAASTTPSPAATTSSSSPLRWPSCQRIPR